MSAAPPPPDADEVERRLAALKSGADPGSLGSPPPPPAAPAAQADGSMGDPPADEPPTLVGEVIDGERAWAPRSDASQGGKAAQPEPGTRTPPPGRPLGQGVRAVSWGISQAEAGRLGLWIGLALVAFGGYLVLTEFFPEFALLGSAALAIAGIVLVAWHLTGRAGAWAVHAGVVLGGFGIARVVADLADLPPAGWGPLGAGLGLLVIAATRARRGEGVRWQAWIGGALAIFGGWGVLGAIVPGFPALGDLIVPAILVLIGVAVLRRGLRTG